MKLILGGIAVTFALWGVGDMFRGGISGAYALKAGDREVSLQEYQDELTLRFAALRQVMGASFTPEVANRLGIQQQVLNDLQTGLLIQLEAKSLGLQIPQSEILKAMRGTAAFQTNGSFNQDSFKQALRRAGISEQRYVDSLNKEILSKLILQNFTYYSADLRPTAELLYRLRNETRDVSFYSFVPPVNEESLPAADDRALEDYYNTYGEQFRQPEYRKLAWVTLSKDDIAKGLSVDDETLKARYEERKASFTKPEQREVSQLLYNTKEEAESALTLLQEGKSFAETVEAIPPQNEMLSLGIVKGDALPEETRDAVFNLAEKEITAPIETSFGWHIFRVENILPAETPSFDTLRDQLKQDWMHSQIEDTIYDMTVELEDSLAAGIPMDEPAKELGLTTHSSDWVNTSGLNLEGKNVNLPAQPAGLLAAGFKLQDETDSVLLEDGKGNYTLVAMSERKDSYIPALKDVKDKVEKAWKERQLRDARREKATTLAEAVLHDAGKLNSDLFRSLRARSLKPTGALPNNIANELTELPPGLRQDIFSQPANGITEAYLLDNEKHRYVLAKVNGVDRLPEELANDDKTNAEIEKIITELRQQYSEDMLTLYLQHLSRKYPVEINRQAIAQISR